MFYFMGLDDNSNLLLNLLLNPENIKLSSFTVVSIAAIVASLGGVVYGFLTKDAYLAATSAMFIPLSNILLSFVAVYGNMAGVHKVFALLLFAPLIFLMVITLIDWWRGRD
jgi:hypothetical protein